MQSARGDSRASSARNKHKSVIFSPGARGKFDKAFIVGKDVAESSGRSGRLETITSFEVAADVWEPRARVVFFYLQVIE